MKFLVKVAVRSAAGMQYLTLRECEEYELAERARRAYEKRNPGLPLMIEHVFDCGDRTSNFEKITASPETLADFLGALPVITAPWDEAFYRQYCDGCPAENCDAENCPHNAERGNPLWWLGLTAEVGK